MKYFDVVPDLKIGDIVEVAGTTIRVELSGNVTELTRTHEGRVYPIGQIGSIVKVHFGRQLVFGFVTLLRMRSEELIEVARPIAENSLKGFVVRFLAQRLSAGVLSIQGLMQPARFINSRYSWNGLRNLTGQPSPITDA